VISDARIQVDSATDNKGFTLIELMAVVSILSILAILALGAYQDYVVRTKVGEGMAFAGEAKTAVSAYYYNRKALPQTNSAAGLSPPGSYGQNFQYIRTLELSSTAPYGIINVTFKIDGSPADGKVVQLIPNTANGIISWTCIAPTTNGMIANHLPPNCRG
jgi:type IV pilus assembly protein PilA